MNKFLLVITTTVGLIVAAVLVGPSMINWNNYKADFIDVVEHLTGRKLAINGDIEISIFPAPAVVANDVYLSNSIGASAKNMFSLKSLEVRIALGPLFGGQVKVQTVRLIDPVIELQRFANGRTNMEFSFMEKITEGENKEVLIGRTPLAEAQKDNETTKSSSKFSLDNFSIENASLIYRDDVLGKTESIENLDATFAAASSSGPFASEGKMVFRGFPLEFL